MQHSRLTVAQPVSRAPPRRGREVEAGPGAGSRGQQQGHVGEVVAVEDHQLWQLDAEAGRRQGRQDGDDQGFLPIPEGWAYPLPPQAAGQG